MKRSMAGLFAVGLLIWSLGVAAEEAGDSAKRSCVVGALNLTGADVSLEALRNQIDGRCEFVESRDVRRRFARVLSDGKAFREASHESDLVKKLKAGIHEFYYEDAGRALETLEESFGRVEKLAGKGGLGVELAGVGWDSGVVILRALKRRGDNEAAMRQAARLVRVFPTGRPEPRKVPPGTRQLIDRQRRDLEARGASLRLEVLAATEECGSTVSGLSAPSGTSIAVDPGRAYRVRAMCGDRPGPVRVVSASADDETTVQLMGPIPSDDTVIDRAKLREENSGWAPYFDAVATRLKFDRLVVFVRTAGEEVGVYGAGTGDNVWADATGSSADEIRQVIGADWSTTGVQTPVSTPADRHSDAGNWALVVGGGALGMGAGIYTLAVLAPRGQQLACSPNNADKKSGPSCENVDRVEFDNQAAFDRAVSDFRLARGFTIGAAAVGVGLTSWGIWRLASRQDRKESNLGLQVDAGRGWAGFQLTGEF